MNAIRTLPFWHQLTAEQQQFLEEATHEFRYEKGTLLHNGAYDCVGLFLILSGQLRVYTISSEGKELTLYRLFSQDLCLLSASCMIQGLQFDVLVSAEEDTTVLHIPTPVYQTLMKQSLPVSNYTNELMASHFSEVMWLMDQMMNQKLDARLAAFLLEEADLREKDQLTLTHEQIANHLGSAREVVSRMLKHFQSEGSIKLGRGKLEIINRETLRNLSANRTRST